jgi:hypothetical protein
MGEKSLKTTHSGTEPDELLKKKIDLLWEALPD